MAIYTIKLIFVVYNITKVSESELLYVIWNSIEVHKTTLQIQLTQLKHVPLERYQVCLLLQIMIILIPAYARLSFKSLPLELNKWIKVTIVTATVGLLGHLVECPIKIKKGSQITWISVTYMYLLMWEMWKFVLIHYYIYVSLVLSKK